MTTGIRAEVKRVAAFGRFPSEADATEEALDQLELAINALPLPLSRPEAALLTNCFGNDSCYGLAWALLHAIETAPGPSIVEHEPSGDANEWIRRLWDAAHR